MSLAFGGGVTYDLLRQMTPREFDSVMLGLREYREEERRAAQQIIAEQTGKQTIGGEQIHNP